MQSFELDFWKEAATRRGNSNSINNKKVIVLKKKKKTHFSFHNEPVAFESRPEPFISVRSTHKAPSGDATFWEWE